MFSDYEKKYEALQALLTYTPSHLAEPNILRSICLDESQVNMQQMVMCMPVLVSIISVVRFIVPSPWEPITLPFHKISQVFVLKV